MSETGRTEPRTTGEEFVRQVHQEHGGARAAELGYRALHAELVEQRSPQRSVTARARTAQELGDEVARRRFLSQPARTTRTRSAR